jgi:hypothetical protein
MLRTPLHKPHLRVREGPLLGHANRARRARPELPIGAGGEAARAGGAHPQGFARGRRPRDGAAAPSAPTQSGAAPRPQRAVRSRCRSGLARAEPGNLDTLKVYEAHGYAQRRAEPETPDAARLCVRADAGRLFASWKRQAKKGAIMSTHTVRFPAGGKTQPGDPVVIETDEGQRREYAVAGFVQDDNHRAFTLAKNAADEFVVVDERNGKLLLMSRSAEVGPAPNKYEQRIKRLAPHVLLDSMTNDEYDRRTDMVAHHGHLLDCAFVASPDMGPVCFCIDHEEFDALYAAHIEGKQKNPERYMGYQHEHTDDYNTHEGVDCYACRSDPSRRVK